jgi:hypothetical protein
MDALEIVKNVVTVAAPTLSSFFGVFFAAKYLRGNTKVEEFEKYKQKKLSEAADLLFEGNALTYEEWARIKKFDEIVQLAEQIVQEKEQKEEADKSDSTSYGTSEKSIDFNWASLFFDYASRVGEDDLQRLWSAILAEEYCNPKSISRSLLFTVSIMDGETARRFGMMSRFTIDDTRGFHHLFLYVTSNRLEYKRAGIDIKDLKKFERLGLIDCDFDKGMCFRSEHGGRTKKVLRYGNHYLEVWDDSNKEGGIPVGNASYTKDGAALYSIVGNTYKDYNNKILDSIVACLKHRNCEVIINGKRV